jgi:hypothetical protein
VVTPSAVAADAASSGFKLTATLTAGTYTVQFQTPTALAVLGIGDPPANGLESNILSFTTTS